MIKLCNVGQDGLPVEGVTLEENKEWILTQLATTFSDDVDFLRKVNKLTFGLQSNQ
jgi:hypothetical protein